MQEAGFQVELLEYWDEQGVFHFQEWSSNDGHVIRSKRYDIRNKEKLTYTSLIIDGIK
jgi:predicted SAM-dependent methyltransferase